jgi:enoyl-[acyl-carrier protein] reductase II
MLGIDVPILQAGMSLAATPELVAAVSNAGGLGVLGSGLHRANPEGLQADIEKVRGLTDRPFGVDIGFAASYQGPAELRDRAGQLINALPEPERGPASRALENLTPGSPDKLAGICLDEGVTAVFSSLGGAGDWIGRFQRSGTKVVALVGSYRQAVAMSEQGVDAVVATGSEAGGHTGYVGSLPLWNACARTLPVPVIGAGGVVDGRGLAAALVSGCVGVWVGTRFVATDEAHAHPDAKAAYLSRTVDDFVTTKSFTGKQMRAVRNRWVDEWRGREAEILPFPLQMIPAGGSSRGLYEGDVETGAIPGGQGAGLIHDIRPAARVVEEMVAEAIAVLANPPGLA